MSVFHTENRDGTLVVTLDRAPLNALSAETLEEGAALLAATADAPPEAGMVLTGANGVFTAGVDIKQAADADLEMRRRLFWGINDFCAALMRLPCPVVAAVTGHAIGAGGIVAIAADWTLIADKELKIGLPEAKAGLPFPQIPQIIMEYGLSPVWHRRLALTSVLYGAKESIEAELADELVPADEIVDRAVARAQEMAAQPAFVEIKANMRRQAWQDIDTVYADRDAG
ncbi:enoyl-CoA hydratase/isomerase family protein [Parasphingopyxis sp. CP4]|uniref:enoyl-CoA hydratase/isomerase family protein n=1 Tax=Parasphingopyxis sp. CP4 TaxID=2724527 RepID=UPI0015A36FCB|nr:enoyl-CoA hydratase/isomerase family protein [Parasphingopyxis sp. CP4]QLC21337.1 enoyl-CoA hydratase/isomerase family protein [Parasphingopyxis sp. CP4]